MTKDTARPTIKDETPNGIEFEYWEYLTGKDNRELQKPVYQFLQGINLSDIQNEEQLNKKVELNPEYIDQMQDNLIEVCLVSLEGKKNNLVERTLDLRIEDTEYIMQKLNELRDGLSPQEKKK